MNTLRFHLLAIGLLVLPATMFVGQVLQPAADSKQSTASDARYGPLQYCLEIVVGGRPVRCSVASVKGGGIVGTLVNDTTAHEEAYARKKVARVSYEPITVQVAPDSCPNALLQAFFNDATFEGAVDGFPFEGEGAVRLFSFREAQITELSFPVMEEGGKDRGAITFRIQPSKTELGGTPGRPLARSAESSSTKWIPSNFRVSLDAVDPQRVVRVDAFSLKRAVGAKQIEVSPITLTVPEAYSQGLRAWFQDFVVGGHNHAAREKKMTIDLLTPDAKPLLSLDCTGVGIFAFRMPSVAEGARKVQVELYVERMIPRR